MRNIRRAARRLLTVAGLLVLNVVLAAAQPDPIVWEPWETLDLNALDDDNSGSTFAHADIDGLPALRITPGGGSEETKLAYPVSGDALQGWVEYGRIQMEVYLPGENTLNPNSFFLGMGEVTGQWRWVGGQFGVPTGTRGWIAVTFTLDAALRQFEPNGAYVMYLSFFHQLGSGRKSPLTEAFYVGAITLEPVGAAQDPSAEERYGQEVSTLLALDDSAFVEAVARETFDFFWVEAYPETGLIKDRSTPHSAASIASVGFGLAGIPIAIDRGWITHEAGYERARITLETFLNGGVQGENGFFYHFVNGGTGERMWNSELSSIDTALLIAGALVAGQYFEGSDVQELADRLYENVQWDWMLGGRDMLRMGWRPESGFLSASWDHFDESLVLYVLAIGSPTHPIPASTWRSWDRPVNAAGEYIYLPGDPLFVYQYPLAFLDLYGREDAYANYWNNTARACERHQEFARDHSDDYKTYGGGVWGLSASDGPSGYRAYGAAEANHDGTIAPYASSACLPFTPEIALEGMRALLTRYGARVWREYGFVSAINEDANWYSREHIGIDQGDILLMIANAQDRRVWDLFMANQNIQTALESMGFTESAGEYAVTPAYLAAATGQ